MYYLYKIGIFLIRCLPEKAGYFIAKTAARLFYVFSFRDRKELKENLRMILGENTSEKTLNKHILTIFINFAKYLVDFFRTEKLTKEYIDKNIKIKGIERLEECNKKGKGAVIVSLHLGNWELGGAVLGILGYPISAIILEHNDKRINNLFAQQRINNGVTPIPVGTQIKGCFKALKNNEIVAVVGDKDYTKNGISVEFFGKKAVLPKGPAVISLRTGSPIVFCCLTREKDDTYILHFDGPIEYEPVGDRKKDEEILLGKYVRIFEKYIKQYPDQWYIFRRLWPQEQTIQ